MQRVGSSYDVQVIIKTQARNLPPQAIRLAIQPFNLMVCTLSTADSDQNHFFPFKLI